VKARVCVSSYCAAADDMAARNQSHTLFNLAILSSTEDWPLKVAFITQHHMPHAHTGTPLAKWD
jgi:hypothetical protein